MGDNAGGETKPGRDDTVRTSGAEPDVGHRVALVDDPLFDEHWAPEYRGHPERPERLQATRAGLSDLGSERAPLLAQLRGRDASLDELVLVHEPRYVEALDAAAGLSGHFDEDTYYAPRSVAAARRAAGGAMELVDTLMRGEVRRGLALLRPPGHHARPSGAMGFCLINNAALAAAAALARGARRVVVVDWDVHHGNGTEEAFYSDPRVLYLSLHQSPLYPGTGAVGDVGAGEGRGFNVNLPLSPGATPDVYRAAFDSVVLPILAEYAPDLLLISAGYDAHERDPLGSMKLTDESYGDMTRSLITALPNVPVGVLLEGGYDLHALQGAVTSTCDALMSGRPDVSPSAGHAAPIPLDTVHAAELERIRRTQRGYWHL